MKPAIIGPPRIERFVSLAQPHQREGNAIVQAEIADAEYKPDMLAASPKTLTVRVEGWQDASNFEHRLVWLAGMPGA